MEGASPTDQQSARKFKVGDRLSRRYGDTADLVRVTAGVRNLSTDVIGPLPIPAVMGLMPAPPKYLCSELIFAGCRTGDSGFIAILDEVEKLGITRKRTVQCPDRILTSQIAAFAR